MDYSTILIVFVVSTVMWTSLIPIGMKFGCTMNSFWEFFFGVVPFFSQIVSLITGLWLLEYAIKTWG